jgi:hypothetical protein
LEREKTLEFKSVPIKNEGEDQRESFRIDDVLPFMLYRLVEQGPIPSGEVIDDLESLLQSSLSDKDINPVVRKVLIHFDKKLNLILERLPIDLVKVGPQPINLGADGMRIKVKKKFDLQEKVNIKLLLPDLPPKEVIVTGTVVRIRPAGVGEYEVALQFNDLSEDARDEIVQHALK